MENFANEYQSALNGAIDNDDTSLVVDSATGSPDANFRIRIDDEYLLVTAKAGTTFTVTRGIEGSTAASHSDDAVVTHVLTAGGLETALHEVLMSHFGTGSGATVIGTATASSTSPLSISVPGGTASGDLVLLAVQTTNSIPNASGPSGGATWTELWRADTSSNEFQAIYWKVAGGSEGSSWSLTHSAGSDVFAAAIVFRGVNDLWHWGANMDSLTAPAIAGHVSGLLVHIFMKTTVTTFSFPEGDAYTKSVDGSGGATTNSIIIAHRDTTWVGDAPSIRATGVDSQYTFAFSAVFYDNT